MEQLYVFATPAEVLAHAADWCEQMRERHACGGWADTPPPATPADFLAWWADEAAIQEDQAAATMDNWELHLGHVHAALTLHWLCAQLRCLGVTPAPLPWEVAHA